jgi:hypothetical protein
MARRPFFSGNYRLGSNANAANLIAQAGAAQGQMFQNLGSQIGGMIQQYGLNKEKRERNENTAVGTLLGMAQNDQPSLSALMQNKDFAKAAESIRKGEGTSKQVDLINSSTAAYRTQQMAGMQRDTQNFKNAFTKSQTELANLQRQLEERTMGDKVQQEHTKSFSLELANEKAYLDNLETKAKSKEDRERFLMEKEAHELKLKTYKNALKKDEGLLRLFEDTYGDKVEQSALETEKKKQDIKSQDIEDEYTEASTELRKAQTEEIKAETKREPAPVMPKITTKMEDELLAYRERTRDIDTGLLKDSSFIGGKLGAEDIPKLQLNPAYEKMLIQQGTGDIKIYQLSLALRALNDPIATTEEKRKAELVLQKFGSPSIGSSLSKRN